LLLEELTMNNAAALYFKEDEFGRPTAAAIALHLWLDESLCPWIWWIL
jgi:hypothetical protein